jgi:hypothetical protein
MRFGLFGSAQAKRGGPDVDSAARFRDFVDNRRRKGRRGAPCDACLSDHLLAGLSRLMASACV